MKTNLKHSKEMETLLEAYGKPLTQEARDLLQKQGLPNKKMESYKYSNFLPHFPQSFHQAPLQNQFSPALMEKLRKLQEFNCPLLVFNNGHFDENLSSRIEELDWDQNTTCSQDYSRCEPFELLNRGHTQKKMYSLELKRQDAPVQMAIVHLNGDQSSKCWVLPQIKITARPFSKAHIFECFLAEKEVPVCTSAITDLELRESSCVEYMRALLPEQNGLHVGKLRATLKEGAHLQSLSFNLGTTLSRNNLEVHLEEKGAQAQVHGLFALKENQHNDNYSLICHKEGETTSQQIFKGLMDDQSHGVFTGKVLIERDAQLSDAKQLNKNLLLSKKARVDTQPQLEVYADDVKCAHGATIGQITEDEIFYLQTRGLTLERAKKILYHAFSNEILDFIEFPVVKKYMAQTLFESFEREGVEKWAL